MRHLLQSNSPPAGVTLPNLSGGQAILYAIVVTAIIIVALCLTIRALFLRVMFRRMDMEQAILARDTFINDPARRVPGGATGLSQAIVELFPKYVFPTKAAADADAEDTEPDVRQETGGCIVCLEEYKEGDVMRRLPECSHAFHAECIDAWFTQHTTCPVCRVSLQPKDSEAATAEASEALPLTEAAPPSAPPTTSSPFLATHALPTPPSAAARDLSPTNP